MESQTPIERRISYLERPKAKRCEENQGQQSLMQFMPKQKKQGQSTIIFENSSTLGKCHDICAYIFTVANIKMHEVDFFYNKKIIITLGKFSYPQQQSNRENEIIKKEFHKKSLKPLNLLFSNSQFPTINPKSLLPLSTYNCL